MREKYLIKLRLQFSEHVPARGETPGGAGGDCGSWNTSDDVEKWGRVYAEQEWLSD